MHSSYAVNLVYIVKVNTIFPSFYVMKFLLNNSHCKFRISISVLIIYSCFLNFPLFKSTLKFRLQPEDN